MENPSLYSRIRRRVIDESGSLGAEMKLIRGAWTLSLAFQPDPGERLFQYDVSLIQVQEQGAAYSCAGGADHESLKALVNMDASVCIPEDPSAGGVAVLDALAGSIKTEPARSFRISGSSKKKAGERAEIVLEEVNLIAKNLKRNKLKICNVGAIGNIVKMLSDAGHEVSVTDLEPCLIGSDLHGSRVLDGNQHTLSSVAESDIAVVTGMTFANGALDAIARAAGGSGTKIILVCETGAWIGRRFILEGAAETVISEPFPFYIFSGASDINVFRKQNAE